MATKVEFIWDVGAIVEQPVFWKNADGSPKDLTGLQGRLQARVRVDDDEPVISLTSVGAGGLTLTPAEGRIDIYIGADVTSAWTFKTAFFDLEIYDPIDPAVVYRPLQGTIKANKNVTR